MVMPPFGSEASVCLANGLPNLGFRACEGLAVEALHATALEIEETLSGAVDEHVHQFVANEVEFFDTVARGNLDKVLGSLGLSA